MRSLILIIFFQFFNCFSQIDCSKYTIDYIPKNLNDALICLDCQWSKNDKEEFKIKKEKDAVTNQHFGAGQNIRNSWGLWEKRKNPLIRYFKRKGIFHPDDISSIILTSFHRQLNKIEIDFDGQIKYFKEYWEKAKEKRKEEIKKQELETQKEFELFNIGNSVKIAFKLHENGPVWAYRIQKYPDLNEEANCYILGIVKGKSLKTKKGKYILIIQIVEMCGYNNVIYNGINDDRLKINEEYNFSLMNYKIQKN
jgi:hypothetical protein